MTLETLETLETAASSGPTQNNEIIMSDDEPASSMEIETTDSSTGDYIIHVEDSMQYNDNTSSSSREELDVQD